MNQKIRSRRWGKHIRCTCSHESILYRPESYFPSDIHLGGVTLSVMLHTSLYVQCYFNKTQKSQNKQTREKGKRKKKYTNRKKTRLSKTRSINILTYDMTISDENSENLFQPKWDALDGRTSDNHKQDSRFFIFSIQNKKLTFFFYLAIY